MKGNIANARAEADAGARQGDERNKQVRLTNWERFTDCIIEIIIHNWIMQKISL